MMQRKWRRRVEVIGTCVVAAKEMQLVAEQALQNTIFAATRRFRKFADRRRKAADEAHQTMHRGAVESRPVPVRKPGLGDRGSSIMMPLRE